ncbi:hypothetical protein HQ545_04635 [Candidatus Woesearchaeota archaeon]|nr:hypothetical protein [Candidatus Woesearchaeota archaeon]
MIDDFVSRFTEQKLCHIVKSGREYFQISPDLNAVMDKVSKNLNREPVCAGLFLGEDKGKRFRSSFALLELLGRASTRWVIVDEKAEWLFLCGRDVFSSSIVKSNVAKGDALVVNKHGEVLGYGKVVGNLNKDCIYLDNIIDRGDFIRREMRK